MANVNVKEISFDIDKISSSAQRFSDLRDDLVEAKQKLQQAMAQVKEGWQGDGADALENLLTEDWTEGLDRYCELMDVLVQLVNEAATTYSQMETNLESLKYKD